MCIEQVECSGDGGGSFDALNRRRGNKHTGQGIASAENSQYITQGGSLERGHNADHGGLRRQLALALVVEEAFRGQARFELFETQEKGSFADGLDAVNVEL